MTHPLVTPVDALNDSERARYARHISLEGFGEEGQRRLRSARVLIIGAGGLGSPAILYLAAAGVGHMTIIDDDRVELSNLQRQVIHTTDSVGQSKADSARAAILRLDPHASVDALTERLTPDNALRLFGSHDVVLDGADNFATRYLANDASELTGTPLVWATIAQFSGQLSVFWPEHGPTLRDLYPDIPPADSVPSCAEGGVLGALVGQLGSMMALEAIKLITGIGEPAIGKLVMIDSLRITQRFLRIKVDPHRPKVRNLSELQDYCQAATPPPEINADELSTANAVLIDVRSDAERESGHIPGDIHIPLAAIECGGWEAVRPYVAGADSADADLPGDIVLYCHGGARSARAVRLLREDPSTPPGLTWHSLTGGYVSWRNTTAT